MADKVIVNGFTEGGHYLVRSRERQPGYSVSVGEAWCLQTTPKLFIKLKVKFPSGPENEVWLDSRCCDLEIVEELA